MPKLEWLDESKYEVVGPSEDTVSPTNDSEDWLYALTDSIRTMIGNPDYHQEGSLQVIRDMITSHYAHYLKPEEVEHWVKHEARVTTAQGIDGISDGQYVNVKDLLSKLNREEEKG